MPMTPADIAARTRCVPGLVGPRCQTGEPYVEMVERLIGPRSRSRCTRHPTGNGRRPQP